MECVKTINSSNSVVNVISNMLQTTTLHNSGYIRSLMNSCTPLILQNLRVGCTKPMAIQRIYQKSRTKLTVHLHSYTNL